MALCMKGLELDLIEYNILYLDEYDLVECVHQKAQQNELVVFTQPKKKIPITFKNGCITRGNEGRVVCVRGIYEDIVMVIITLFYFDVDRGFFPKILTRLFVLTHKSLFLER